MSNQKIKDYLVEEIKRTEKRCCNNIDSIKLLEQTLELHDMSLKNKIEKNYPGDIVEQQVKKVNHYEEQIEILKKKVDIDISQLASKKANLHWIDGDTDYE